MTTQQRYGYDATGLWVRLSSADRTDWRYWRGGRAVNALRVAEEGAGDAQLTWVGVEGTPLAEQVVGPGARATLLAAAPGGSVLLEVDTAVRPLAYAPHGHRDGTSALTEHGFNGERFDAGSGCYLLGPGHHRPYSPTLAMFLAPDVASPFGDGGLNALAYCVGDPVNLSDPSGHFWKWIVAGVGLALGAVAVVATFGAASAAVGAVAAGGIAALTKSGAAAIAMTTLGALSVGAEVGAIAAGAAGDQKAAAILGFVGLGLGIAGAVPAVAKTAMKGATRFFRFAKNLAGRRSGAMPMRGVAAGSARATQAALPPPSTPSLARTPSLAGSPSWGGPSGALPELSPAAARRAAARHMFGRRRAVRPGAASNGEYADNLVATTPDGAEDWVAPPLKQYPSPAYTTGHNPSAFLSANRPVDVNGLLLIDDMMRVRTPVGRWHHAMRRIVARRAAWRDPAPGYDRSTLPSYDSLEFDA